MANSGCHGRNLLRLFGVVAALFLLALRPGPAVAAAPPYSSIVENAATGQILEAQDPDGLRHPASLTKLMTLYMTFEALRDHRISLHELVPISAHAASMPPTKLGLVPGMRMTVHQAILGLITRSANDAAVALAELLGGSEGRFAQMMTLRAHALGMLRTNFVNASGLPATEQWSTARDMALLARRLIADFPGDYHYFSTPSFIFHGQFVGTYDGMLKLYPGVDGLKTGFVDASGHNLVTSAVNGGVRLVGVEFGAPTNATCYSRMTTLLNATYASLDVPVMGNRTELAAARAPRLPSLIATARADTLHRQTRHLLMPPPQMRPVSSLRLLPAEWGIQVGAFRSPALARAAAARARRLAGGGPTRLERVALRGGPVWRAQLIGFTRHKAYAACGKLARYRSGCIVLHFAPPGRSARS
ncbi:MAG: D-alanyl-D-alanine carboxypeptidase [Proteobacteria bacterium]|nr:D-alanyl-D-alanine carboxypeptidase [Pseudomonadota bacterium]